MVRLRNDNTLGAELRAARAALGLTQQAVAEAADLTQAHLSLMERGMDSHLSVFERAAAVVGARLGLQPLSTEPPSRDPYGDDETANRLYLLGRLAAKRLTSERLARFRHWIDQARSRVGDYPYFQRWRDICDEGPEAVAAVFTNTDEFGRYMRSVATFRPFVSQAERDSYFRRDLPPVIGTL